nr:hypothetical protein [Tanacetum cinerariifolium]
MSTLKFADTHNMVAFLSKPTKSEGFEQIVDFLNTNPIKYALTVNLTKYVSCIEHFWSTTKAKTINGEGQILAKIDGKKATPNESSSQVTDSGGGPMCQEAIGITIAQTSLKRKVKKLKKKQRSKTHKLKTLYKVGLTARVESLDDEQSLGEDASKHMRIRYIDADEGITLVSTHDDPEVFDADNDLHGEEVFVPKQNENVVEKEVELKHAKPKAKAKRIISHELEESTTTTTIPKPKSLDKGKAIMFEEPVKLKKKDQIMLDEEVALKLQAEFDKEQRLAREKA